MRRTAKKQPEVSFDCQEADYKIASAIARRAHDLLLDMRIDRPALDIHLDIVATHCNGNPLRLQDLLDADDFSLLHDVSGIALHLNRETGKLENHFRPRFSKREAA